MMYIKYGNVMQTVEYANMNLGIALQDNAIVMENVGPIVPPGCGDARLRGLFAHRFLDMNFIPQNSLLL